MTPPSFTQVRNDLIAHLYAFAYAQDLVVRPDASSRLLGTSADGGFESWPSYAQFNLKPIVVAEDLEPLYQYAFYGQLTVGVSDDRENGNLGRLQSFVQMAQAGDVPALLEELRDLFEGDADDDKAMGLAELVERAIARYALDTYSELTLDQVALLANIGERTARNAQHATGPARLATSVASNGKTVVARAEAERWLRGRQNFRPTVWAGGRTGLPDALPAGDVLPFIRRELAARFPENRDQFAGIDALKSLHEDLQATPADPFGISRRNAAHSLNWPADRINRILDGDVNTITENDCDALSTVLRIDAAWLKAQVKRAHAGSGTSAPAAGLALSALNLEAQTLDVVLHDAGIRNGYIDIERRYADLFFPSDVYGSRGEGSHGNPVAIHDGMSNAPWLTDLRVKSKALVSPRKRFVGYFSARKAKAGDVIRFKRVAEREYHIEFIPR